MKLKAYGLAALALTVSLGVHTLSFGAFTPLPGVHEDGEACGEEGCASSGWVMVEEGWKYQNADFTYKKSEWVSDRGMWYYLGTDEVMMTSQWVDYLGDYYYLSDSGAMLTDTETPDGYQVDKDGKRL